MSGAGTRTALTAADRARIARAIHAAEQGTAGEIYCVVARRSGDYRWVVLLAAGLLALLVPLALLLAGVRPDVLARSLTGDWTVAHDGAPVDAASWGAGLLLLLQALIFAGLSALLLQPGLSDFLVPGPVRRQAVHRAALDQFCAHGIAGTRGRTGVLIYVSLAEHVAEVVADSGIHDRVEQSQWSGIAGQLAARAGRGELAGGLVEAVEASGALLASHFPPAQGDEDELPDRVVLI